MNRSLTDDMALYEWYQQVANGHIADAQANATLIQYRPNGSPIAKWELTGAWPARYTRNPAGASTSEAVEEIELAVETVRRVKP